MINIYRVQVYNSMVCRYFSIEFIGFTLKSKSLLNSINLFSPNEYENYNTRTFSVTQNWKFLSWIDSKKVMINMGKEHISQEYKLKNIEETKIVYQKNKVKWIDE